MPFLNQIDYLLLKENFLNLLRIQYSKTLDKTGLIAMPLKSSHELSCCLKPFQKYGFLTQEGHPLRTRVALSISNLVNCRTWESSHLKKANNLKERSLRVIPGIGNM